MVALAVADGVAVAGLTVHTGVEVVACVDVTAQPRATVPLNPFTGSTRIEIDEVLPGAMATGSSEDVVRVNSLVPCALAVGASIRSAANRQKPDKAPSPVQNFTLDSDPSNFTMSRFK